MRRVAQLLTVSALTVLSIAAFARVVPERGCPGVGAERRAVTAGGECPAMRDAVCPYRGGQPTERPATPRPQRDGRLVAAVL